MRTGFFRKAGLALSVTVCVLGLSLSGHAAEQKIKLTKIGGAQIPKGVAEIVDYDAKTQRVFATNSTECSLSVFDLKNPADPKPVQIIGLKHIGKEPTSVAVHQDKKFCAVCVLGPAKGEKGTLVFFNTETLKEITRVTVGYHPDMVTFTPNGKWVLVANEGEPADDYKTDPVGSISLVDLSNGPEAVTQDSVMHADFAAFNSVALKDVRVFGKGATPAQDFEPEYITVDKAGKTAWVTLQENNAVAVVDLKTAKVSSVVGLGYKDHSKPGNGFDASNKDGRVDIRPHPVMGMYLPDAIAAYEAHGKTYLITANEGDARDYEGYSEETRVKKLKLDAKAFPNASELQKDENLGRLKTTKSMGDTDGDGDVDVIYSYGSRSFSIWEADTARQVFDSADWIERKVLAYNKEMFNSTNDEDAFDDRSDDKGPEPEGLAIGKIDGDTYAFIGLERVGGIMVFNVSDPAAPTYVDYINTRTWGGDFKKREDGDNAPEGMRFIGKDESPNKKDLLLVAYEVSGTLAVFQIDVVK